jgi:DNA-binding NtrC family response regulator
LLVPIAVWSPVLLGNSPGGVTAVSLNRTDRERVPVVAITGFGRSNDIERARASGFYAHLTKPLDLDALVAVLKQLTQERSLGDNGVVSERKFTYSSSLTPRNSGWPASEV